MDLRAGTPFLSFILWPDKKALLRSEAPLAILLFKIARRALVREKGGINADRIKNDPAFQRTRENGNEFGRACKAGKLLRQAIRPLLLSAQDSRLVSRLVTEMMKVIPGGQYEHPWATNVFDGETECLMA
jgi:hypothetical protein